MCHSRLVAKILQLLLHTVAVDEPGNEGMPETTKLENVEHCGGKPEQAATMATHE